MNSKRILSIFAFLVFVTLVAAGGWFAGSTISSPAEEAARTAPPQPSPILVPIERRTLTSNVVTRGLARFGIPRVVALAPSPLKVDAGVITSLPQLNAELNEGDLVLTASGRPLRVLQGDAPAFRDLVPGLQGDDVRQLQEALVRLGYALNADGNYDEQTSQAVAEWYRDDGWIPFDSTASQLANIRALEIELETAERARLAAQDVVVAAPSVLSAARSNANAAAQAATNAVNTATTNRAAVYRSTTLQSSRDAADADLLAAQAAQIASQEAGTVEIQTALDAIKAAERELISAETQITRLTADLERARQGVGFQVPLDEIIFLPNLPVRVEELFASVGDAASGPIISFTNFRVAIDSSLALDEAPLVKPGMTIIVDEPDLGIEATGVVGLVADQPGTNGVDGFHVYLEIIVEEPPPTLVGVSVRLTLPIESSGGEVVAVPISAVSLSADGTSRVQVERNGALEFITVEPGLSADGYVEVTTPSSDLEPDQLVVIGFNQQ